MTREQFTFIWETTAIFLAVFALLFWRFASQHHVLRWSVLVGALLMMILVAVRRVRRLHRLKDERQKQGPGPPGPPPPFLR